MNKNTFRTVIMSLCLASLFVPQFALSQQTTPSQTTTKFELTIDSIMRGPRLVGYAPSNVYWSQDSKRVYFRWKQADEPRLKEMSLYVVDRDGSNLKRLSDEEARLAPPPNGELSKDKTRTLYTEEGNIYLYDHASGQRKAIIKTSDPETNARFTFDQKAIYFTRQSNLYVMSLDGGSLEQLTDIRTSTATTPAPQAGPQGGGGGGQGRGGGGGFGFGGGGQGGGAQASSTPTQRGSEGQDYLKKEERALIDAIREKAEQREEQEAKRKQRETKKSFTVPTGQNITSLNLSPDGKLVIATLIEPNTTSKSTVVPNYVTESGYTEDIPGRAKAVDGNGRNRIVIIDVASGETKNVDHGQRLAPATPTQATEQPQRQQGPPRPPQPRDREVQLAQVQWSEDGKNAVINARSADNKDRWVLLLDPATGKTTVLATVHDDAWIGGPGGFTLGWMPDNTGVYFQSERDGYSHLYKVAIGGGEPTQLTSGQFEVSDVKISRDKTKFYFTSSEGSPYERHLYSMPINGGPRTRITAMAGNNAVDLSPDETTLADVRSYSNKPPELYLLPNVPAVGTTNTDAKSVTTSPTSEFTSHNWIEPKIIEFKARDGASVPARMYVPTNWKRGGPAVLFVHGAGYLQNVHRWWSSYYREYMFHHLLMERGFLVLDVDYRGSAGYGRDWRTGIYRHMGGKDLSDHVDAVNFLVKEHGVDPKRVGLYGGSYGGFITLMALFTEPDVFAAGAALRPVTDWAHYSNGYTANILNLPQGDPEAYKKSSPIYFANGLKSALLICHGMVDTNVNFQDTVRLVEKLIELRKENWEVAPYPVEDHGFEREESWADEYKRIFKLFNDNLKPGTTVARPANKSTTRNTKSRPANSDSKTQASEQK